MITTIWTHGKKPELKNIFVFEKRIPRTKYTYLLLQLTRHTPVLNFDSSAGAYVGSSGCGASIKILGFDIGFHFMRHTGGEQGFDANISTPFGFFVFHIKASLIWDEELKKYLTHDEWHKIIRERCEEKQRKEEEKGDNGRYLTNGEMETAIDRAIIERKKKRKTKKGETS